LCRLDAVNKESEAWHPGRFTFYGASEEISVLLPTVGVRSSEIHKAEIDVTLRVISVPGGAFTERKFKLGMNEDLSVRVSLG